ncbi:MAG: cyclase family protein, partial [Planctomycetota bacterium]
MIIDISPSISPRLAVWPGDVPFTREVSMDMVGGDHLTLSAIRGTVHLGAHVDAPNHYERGGEDIAARALERYFGPCQVIRVDVPQGERILPEHVVEEITAERVLFHTGSSPDPESWNSDFCALIAALVEHLA